MRTKARAKIPQTNPSADVRILRSARRLKTVAARWVGDMLEIVAPAGITDAELAPIVERLRDRMQRRRARVATPSDDSLEIRAQELNQRYFDGQLKWTSIRYVDNQNSRFGSCTHETGTIRLSARLKQFPTWVLDYVIVHELAHLIHPDHSKAFWEATNRYPRTERARGFLIGSHLAEDEVNGNVHVSDDDLLSDV
jgi:hypothetical protein